MEETVNIVVASTLYQVTGKKKEKKVIDKAMEEYEKFLKDYFESFGFDEKICHHIMESAKLYCENGTRYCVLPYSFKGLLKRQLAKVE